MSNFANEPNPPVDLLRDGMSLLDDLKPRDLLDATRKTIETSGGTFQQALAQRLDKLFAVKCVRLLRSARAPAAELTELDDLIARVGRERFAAQLDAWPQRYFARWTALRDLLAVALALEEHADYRERERPVKEESVWSFVAELVLREARHGVPWGDVASALEEEGLGPQSKSGVSNLISAMRLAGWIETVAEGRKKRVYPGPRIHNSSAYDVLLSPQIGSVVPSRTASVIAQRDTSEFLREVVCLNQGKLVEYDRLASLKHGLLDREMAMRGVTLPRPSSEAGYQRRQRLAKMVDDLDGFLQGTFQAVAQKNFTLLKNYFSTRSESMPRICIKGNWRSGKERTNEVATVIRDDDVSYRSTAPVGENTAFAFAVKAGRWCLINDIPKATLKGVYKNHRLDDAVIREWMSLADEKRIEEGTALTHYQWAKCWKDYSEEADPRCFYRSTLVIPMTLRNNNMSRDFSDTFKSDKTLADGIHDRTVVGFLCLDHVDPNFFNTDVDVAVGYVLADLLSVYLFKWVGLTRFSENYTRARSALVRPEYPDFSATENAKVGVYFERETSIRNESLDLKMTSRNALLQLQA